MKVTAANNVYSLVLTEQEWYGIGEAEQHVLTANAVLSAKERHCQYISIMVEPDPVLSMSPIPTRHQVFRHTAPSTTEEELYKKLLHLADSYVKPGKLNIAQARVIAKRVFG